MITTQYTQYTQCRTDKRHANINSFVFVFELELKHMATSKEPLSLAHHFFFKIQYHMQM